MLDNITDYVVLLLLLFDLVCTAWLIRVLYKYKKLSNDLSTDLNLLKNKSLMLVASNQILKSTNSDYKSEIEELSNKNKILLKKISDISLKYETSQKKLQAFSKMIGNIKNS